MLEWAAGLPPYLKYVVLTVTPTVELRGAIPLAVGNGDYGYIPLIVLLNCLVFFPTYFILQWVYIHIPEGTWLHRKLERVRHKAHPLVEKYGVMGLAAFVAVPLPGTGAYSGSAAAWLLDMKWHKAFLSISIGVVVALGIMWGGSEVVKFVYRLF
ncbi:MAG: small multi-drug export protein [Actinomycetota bacterium]|nr:small multi-drug export protein [Actinomycetota bacterium]